MPGRLRVLTRHLVLRYIVTMTASAKHHKPAGLTPDVGIASHRLLALVIVVTALTAELIRFSGPLLDSAIERGGVISAALTALATYLAPGVLAYALSARRQVSGAMVVTAVVALAAARVLLQFLDGLVRYGVGLATVALAIATLGVVVAGVSSSTRQSGDTEKVTPGQLVGLGVGLGLLLSATLNLALTTWDPLWRPGVLPMVFAVALGASTVWLVLPLKSLAPQPHTRGVWALGPVLSLGVVIFANPAFQASQAQVPLWLTVLVFAAGAAALPRVLTHAREHRYIHGVAVVLSVVTIFFIAPWPATPSALVSIAILLSLLILSVSAPALLSLALSREPAVTSSGRLSGAIAAAGLLVILPILLFQLDYDIPLGFPNALLFVGAATVLAGAGLAAARTAQPHKVAAHYRLVLPALSVIGVLGLVGLFQTSSLAKARSTTQVAPDSAKVFNWNLHYGTNTTPSVDLDAMVTLIQAEQATVVTLQEVSRGWIMGGGADMITYLAQKLGMDYAFVGAADLQFGNALLWHPDAPITDIERFKLTYGDGPQWRSAIGGTVNLAEGQFRVITAHLQHRDENTPTRISQLDDLFADMPANGATLITGDFNAEPGWAEIDYLFDHGFASGQDTAGDPAVLTWPTYGPAVRIDWMFGKDLGFTDYQVLDSVTSDHFPMSATVTLKP